MPLTVKVNPVVKYFLLQVGNFARSLSAVIQWQGKEGLSSVIHGKLVAYKATFK